MGWPTSSGNDPRKPRILVPFGGQVGASTETPLKALTEWGLFYSDLVFTLRNYSLSNRAALYVDQSEDGAVTDDDREIIYVGANKERRYEFRDVLALLWGCSASGDPEAAFPAVNVTFQVVGRARIR